MTDDDFHSHATSNASDDRLDDLLTRGTSRRETLKALAAAGFFAAGGSSLLLGPKARAAENTPKHGGHIRVAVSSSSTQDTLDPARGATAIDYCRDFMFYNGLTAYDEHLAPQPALAESFHSPDGGKHWVFKLRRGVTFHNGKAFAPEDVVFSIMRQKNPETESKIKPLADQIADVKASGDHEVTVTLVSPNVDFPSITAISHMLIVPAGTTDFSKGIGTGPFKCKDFQPGVRSVAQRNPDYWKSGKPYLDAIEMVGIGDKSSRINALLSGGVQMINDVDPHAAKRLQSAPNTRLSAVNSGNYTDLIMRLDLQPGARPAFVEGMKYLLDRKRMKNIIYSGYAEIANDQPLPPTNPYYFAGLPQRPFDPDRARSLFKKAGVAGAKLQIIASEAANGSVEMATLLQQSAAQADLKVQVKRAPAEGYWSNDWAKKPVTFGNINPRPTANILFSQFFTSGAPWNESHWHDPKFDQLVVAARQEPDKAKRKQMYADMQQMIHNSSGIGIPLFITDLTGYSHKLGGMDHKIPLGGMLAHRFAEYVWWKG
ncbi:ABC transporter substrate-binding protein [Salinisphaera sp. Q1T1-3]|uniref:ABC transporter substrate-binding protein n=1 Tax=Salinisphaera sp. Q1T1-3 TaxID=2321229 RepID=UPI000E74B6EF|nr:ABC transporter substrate-binding protein [Salinisphaera sp. Q1T1-3]RJS91837.1 ABC transporter substrate-binding protein [Salinisphaera sp. Q1T1-3]